MARPYSLKPIYDKKLKKYRLSVPGTISSAGKRERKYFEHHHEALAEANKIRTVRREFGSSFNMLPANRHIEAVECWKLLDKLYGGEAPWGSLRRVVIAEVNQRKAREKSITFAALLDSYVEKLKRTGRSENYLKQFRWLRGYMDTFADTKVSDITPGNIGYCLKKLRSGNFNSNVRLLRAVFSWGVKHSWLKSNPALSVDMIHREKQAVTCLHPTVVEKMFRHAQQNDIELIPSFTIGFFCGLRESELWRMSWKSVNLTDPQKHVMVPAAITKTKEPRTVPLSENAVAWLEWFFANVRQPDPSERVMEPWTPNRYRAARTRCYRAVVGSDAKWVHNAKRHCFASYWLALHRNLNELVLLLGHTTPTMARRHYLGAATHADAQAYFQIRP